MSQPNGNGIMLATEPLIRARLDELLTKRYESGVVGMRAMAKWAEPARFTHRGTPVLVVPCLSTLAVWEAVRQRETDAWLVILTPRDDDDLGAGVLSHLIGQRVRPPDPWQAVRQRFQATSIEPALYARHDQPGAVSDVGTPTTREAQRAVATGLLAAMPPDGWPPAPGGVLTRNHALESVARARLHVAERGMEIDVRAVLEWSVDSSATTALADLRTLAGDPLTDIVIDWMAERCGLARGPVGTLLRAGRVAELVPLGLIAGLLPNPEPEIMHAAGVLQGHYGLRQLSPDVLTAWHADAAGLVTQTFGPDLARRLVGAAAATLSKLDLEALAVRSDLLEAGLDARLAALAAEFTSILPNLSTARTSTVDKPIVTGDLRAVHAAWERVREHYLADGEPTVVAFGAALRLLRWLATDAATKSSLATFVRRQIDVDAWVDVAVNDCWRGALDAGHAEVLGRVLDLVRSRRDQHDLAFAAALTGIDDQAIPGVERLLPDLVVPLSHKQPVLLLVIDALSVGVATELVTAAVSDGWAEYGLGGSHQRGGALAVLPSITAHSRCSLLSGELRSGNAADERTGFAALLKQSKLGSAAVLPLFHQKDLDVTPAGLALAPAVRDAIADTKRQRLVAAVLNTVDDTLHHTDPGGADWRLTTIKHMRPLLDAARHAGRTVVITADHGHVIERRAGEYRDHATIYGDRCRPVTEHVADDEIVVRGPRVLTEHGVAVLAVNERIRYAALRAGYHGGAAPAEVVVPVVVLYAGEPPVDANLTPVIAAEPTWWLDRAYTHMTVTPPTLSASTTAMADAEPSHEDGTLFAVMTPEKQGQTEAERKAESIAKTVVASKAYAQQKEIAGRVPMADEKIKTLLTSLLAAPGTRIPAGRAAADLGIAETRLRGALPLLKRVLDVEGYVVLRYEAESGEVALNEAMLREQFGLTK